MTGLEKTKADAGEISHSARASGLEDMHRLFHITVGNSKLSFADRRAGTIRYVRFAYSIPFSAHFSPSDNLLVCMAPHAAH